nr:DUF481 domain-containing protein [Stakelama sediminis]
MAPLAHADTGDSDASPNDRKKEKDDLISRIPPSIYSMLQAAMAAGKEGDVATIIKYARSVNPEGAAAAKKLADDWSAKRTAKATRHLQQANFFDLVTGKITLGGYLTTGNTNNIGITGTIDVERDGYKWRHKLHMLADYQKSNGVVSREHYLVAYEPNYKVNSRLYIYGATQYESDRFLGFYDRYSVSSGAGYSAIKRPSLKLDLELGPAYRYTNFTDDTNQSNIAARGSLSMDWKLSSTMSFHQDASAYLQSANSTVATTSSLNAKLFGPVSGQLSYQVQYESLPPAGSQTTDTTSRASVVYQF